MYGIVNITYVCSKYTANIIKTVTQLCCNSYVACYEFNENLVDALKSAKYCFVSVLRHYDIHLIFKYNGESTHTTYNHFAYEHVFKFALQT